MLYVSHVIRLPCSNTFHVHLCVWTSAEAFVTSHVSSAYSSHSHEPLFQNHSHILTVILLTRGQEPEFLYRGVWQRLLANLTAFTWPRWDEKTFGSCLMCVSPKLYFPRVFVLMFLVFLENERYMSGSFSRPRPTCDKHILV
jgi:hypothetical protein